MVIWNRVSNDALEEAEQKLIHISGLNYQSFRISLDENTSIFGLSCGEISNPPMILLHGFLGTSIIFYKLLQPLAQHYRIYSLDLLGMGRSSRPDFTAANREETEEFFVTPIEACRVALNIEKMILAGHSFGGYLAGCYAERFPERVEKIVFISAVGVVRPPEGYDHHEELKKRKWSHRTLFKFAHYLFKNGTTPTTILRKTGPFSGKLVKMYLKRRMKGISEEELEALQTYLEQVNLYPGSGEFGLSKVLKDGIWAISPICDRILNTPAIYLYGDNDWMNPKGASQNKLVNKSPVLCEIVSKSGHHLYMDNPFELGEKIINGLIELERLIKNQTETPHEVDENIGDVIQSM